MAALPNAVLLATVVMVARDGWDDRHDDHRLYFKNHPRSLLIKDTDKIEDVIYKAARMEIEWTLCGDRYICNTPQMQDADTALGNKMMSIDWNEVESYRWKG